MHIPFLDCRIGQAESFGLFIIYIYMNFPITEVWRSDEQRYETKKPGSIDFGAAQ